MSRKKQKECLYCKLLANEASFINSKTSKRLTKYYKNVEFLIYRDILSKKDPRSLHSCGEEHHLLMLTIRKVNKFVDTKMYKHKLKLTLLAIDQKIEVDTEIEKEKLSDQPSEQRLKALLQRQKEKKYLLAQRGRRLREAAPQNNENKALIDNFLRKTLEKSGFIPPIIERQT